MISRREITFLGAIVLLGGILGTTYAFDEASTNGINQISTNGIGPATAGLMGHVTISVEDSEGNIKSYIQSDNVVVRDGKNCGAERIFGVSGGGSAACGFASVFEFIAIGNGVGPTFLDTADELVSEILVGTDARSIGNVVIVDAVGGNDFSVATIGPVQFTMEVNTLLTETGLFNTVNEGVANSDMFATLPIDANPIDVDINDVVNVTWKVNVGT